MRGLPTTQFLNAGQAVGPQHRGHARAHGAEGLTLQANAGRCGAFPDSCEVVLLNHLQLNQSLNEKS